MFIDAILVPHALAEVCFLSEALMWVAFSRFPLGAPIHESWDDDSRRNMDNMFYLDPNVDVEDPTDAECVSVGLSPRPADVTNQAVFGPEYLKEMLDSGDFEDRIQLEQALEEAISFREAVARRERELCHFLDLHRAKLFIALREGKLVAQGIELPEKSYEASLARLSETHWEGWSGSEWISIPPDFWHSEKINWKKCLAEGRDATFALIQIETVELLACFPPQPTQATDVVRVANNLIAVELEGDESKARNLRGRPPFNWQSFHVEIAMRIKSNSFPEKQCAFPVPQRRRRIRRDRALYGCPGRFACPKRRLALALGTAVEKELQAGGCARRRRRSLADAFCGLFLPWRCRRLRGAT
jgi:hypothetical protein